MSIFDPANCIIPTVVSLMFANMHLAIDTVKVIPFSNRSLLSQISMQYFSAVTTFLRRGKSCW